MLACCTHPVLSGAAITRIEQSGTERADRYRHDPLRPPGAGVLKVTVLSVAHLFGEAIRRTHDEESISSLFV